MWVWESPTGGYDTTLNAFENRKSRFYISWFQAMDWSVSNCSIWKGFVPILVLVSFILFGTTHLNSKYIHRPFKTPVPQENYMKRVKRILFFNPPWWTDFGSGPFEKCPNKNCFVTNKGNPEDFDAILFHAKNFTVEKVSHGSCFLGKLSQETDDMCRFLIREEGDMNRLYFLKT